MSAVLASAGFVDRGEQFVMQRSNPELGMVHSRRINTLRPRRLALRWEAASRAATSAILDFVETYLQGGQFDYTPPSGVPGKFEIDGNTISYEREGSLVRIEVPIRLALATDP